MMATLTAAVVASSSIAIHLFCAPDLGEFERPRPWPPLDLAHGCSTLPSPRFGRRWPGDHGHGRGRDRCFVAEGHRGGLVDCVVVGGGIGGSTSPRAYSSGGQRSWRAERARLEST
ncbi:hypothetical protein NL676_003654 [Syzygium grande]|nr:hypothetical protein NL676_003654 [Syzygium grande]